MSIVQGQPALWAIFQRFRHCQTAAYHHIDGDLRYDELYFLANDLSRQLIAQGDGAVMIYGHKDKRYLIAVWACILAGRAFVPAETDNSTARLTQVVAGAGVQLVLNATADAAHLTQKEVPWWPVALVARRQAQPVLALRQVPPSATMYIMFSSGTTGLPKGIAVSYDNVSDFVGWLAEEFVLNGAVSGNIRYCFDVSLFELWLAWLNLQPLSALDHREFINTRKYISRHAAYRTVTWVSTPTITRYYLNDKMFSAVSLPHLTHFIFCGEVLSKALVSELWQRFPGCRITNTYGPTECTVAVTHVDIQPKHLTDTLPLPLGSVRPGTAIEIAPAAAERGEMVIKGRSVGVGYLNATPQQQARYFIDAAGVRGYHTGDLGSVCQHWFYFWGRTDREIKLQGYRIELNEIEGYLRSLDQVREAFIEPWYRRDTLQGISAFVLSDDPPDFAAMGQAMCRHFPPYMIPKRWYAITHQSLNLNSKLDRKAVSESATREGKYYVFVNDAGDR
ncbi:alanine-phosphoribitol ligase [Prodigiosinella confusarubida]|uniref:Alanine-phosphoribitol ligase n=1 Tax=Serratia sp. (strain ATCC 39006) TaxID=104623 RepID=A0A2I5T9H3_SERS3|nr:AMP-binding protein [Serratia sp. ATCC 39006]AUH01221.1 alanine-phosphoribitol ligase [Serratia sp. ATCC 39006]AUH05542.1 alanine-phosphoribitol ligase [Serratia sp. ATCC 39006]